MTAARRYGRSDVGAAQRYPGAGAGTRTAEPDDVHRMQGRQCRQSGQQAGIDLAAGQRRPGGARDVDIVIMQQWAPATRRSRTSAASCAR